LHEACFQKINHSFTDAAVINPLVSRLEIKTRHKKKSRRRRDFFSYKD
jgi:hypothetical protein